MVIHKQTVEIYISVTEENELGGGRYDMHRIIHDANLTADDISDLVRKIKNTAQTRQNGKLSNMFRGKRNHG
jgi:hypothetical protein